jgi:hypothetical protein
MAPACVAPGPKELSPHGKEAFEEGCRQLGRPMLALLRHSGGAKELVWMRRPHGPRHPFGARARLLSGSVHPACLIVPIS